MRTPPEASEVVSFWLADSVKGPAQARDAHRRWYTGGPAQDQEIIERFGKRVHQAIAGELRDWLQTATGSLALVILLDQFTRNVFRDTPNAYGGDQQALNHAKTAVARGFDQQLEVPGSVFLYHPFHHSERLSEQNRGVAHLLNLSGRCGTVWGSYVRDCLDGFRRHRDIVARFGRFPHRNQLLDRQSTAQEEAWLAAGAPRFGQGETRNQ